MCTISARCPRSAALAICRTIIALAGSACADPAPADSLATVGDAAAVVADVPDSAAPSDASAASADGSAAAAPTDAASADAAARESVDADGVRGALADLPFLADTGGGKRNLILVDWEIPPKSELYLCGRVTVPEDAYFNEIQPVNPVGTHHTAVGLLDRPNRPDGVTPCDLSELGRRGIDASGVGTTGARMPPGIAMKADRGTQLLLNLHLFNTTNAPLRGRSGALALTVAAAQVSALADSVAAGPTKLRIPPGQSVQTGICTIEYDYRIFSFFPHMHEMGRHMKVVAKRAGHEPLVLYDGAFDFTHQLAYPLDPPLAMAAGDQLEIACTYDNKTGAEVHFGESSNDEMCLVQLGRFPGGGIAACPF